MRIEKLGKQIVTLEDWFEYAPPQEGEKQWKDFRSAKEMAKYWLDPSSETRLSALLEPVFGSLWFLSAEPERKVQFDTCGEPRHCDLAIQAQGDAEKVVIHIEGKADELFDKIVGPYYARRRRVVGSKLPLRVELLADRLFGRGVDEDFGRLWYQLLHGSAAAWCDAVAHGATSAVFIVQEFRSSGLKKKSLATNEAAWKEFLHSFPALAMDTAPTETSLMGPVRAHYPEWQGVPLYFAKIITTLSA
jgi:hypothetical protein